MTTSAFFDATAVRSTDGSTFAGEIQPTWDIAGNANGGYLLAMAARAVATAAQRRDPVTVTAHYLSPGKPGPVSIATSVVKEGRRFSTGTALMTADAKPVLALLGSFQNAEATSGPELTRATRPILPPVEDCVAVVATETFPPPFMGHVQLRLHPDDAGFLTGSKNGVPRLRGWCRLADDEPFDSISLLCAADAFPPTIFNTDLPIAWAPTIELTVHVRDRPAPGWLSCHFESRFISGGLLETDGELWDDAGTLVAQSRQLLLVPAPQS